jgi:hypothetical protein
MATLAIHRFEFLKARRARGITGRVVVNQMKTVTVKKRNNQRYIISRNDEYSYEDYRSGGLTPTPILLRTLLHNPRLVLSYHQKSEIPRILRRKIVTL